MGINTFAVTVMAASANEALARVSRYVGADTGRFKLDGFAVTGNVVVRSERHKLFSVEVADLGGDRNNCWVVLTSFGMSPSDELGSFWQDVVGVGK